MATRTVYEKAENQPKIDDADGTDVENAPPKLPTSKDEEDNYPKGLALALILGALWMSLFLVALVSSLCRR